MHIEGIRNKLSNIPLRLFGSNPAWKCNSDAELLTLFNCLFSLPQQQSWTIYRLNYAVATRVTSVLQMKPFVLEDWRQLPTRGRCAGKIGAPTSNTWAWICTSNMCHMQPESGVSQGLQRKHEQGSTDMDNKYRVAQSMAQLRPLDRQSLWPATKIQLKSYGSRSFSSAPDYA